LAGLEKELQDYIKNRALFFPKSFTNNMFKRCERKEKVSKLMHVK
jgi:hypothetical protein